jgi:hypothetical protein
MSSRCIGVPTIYRFKGSAVSIVKRIRCGCGCPNCPKPVTQVKIEEIGGKWTDYCSPHDLVRIDG